MLENRVSTRFFLSTTALIGTLAYGWVGPLDAHGGTASDVLGTVVKIVGIYVVGKIAKDITEAVKK